MLVVAIFMNCVQLDILVGHLREMHGKWPVATCYYVGLCELHIYICKGYSVSKLIFMELTATGLPSPSLKGSVIKLMCMAVQSQTMHFETQCNTGIGPISIPA